MQTHTHTHTHFNGPAEEIYCKNIQCLLDNTSQLASTTTTDGEEDELLLLYNKLHCRMHRVAVVYALLLALCF